MTQSWFVLLVLLARSRPTQQRTRAPILAPKEASSSGVATMGSLRRELREVLASLMQVVGVRCAYEWDWARGGWVGRTWAGDEMQRVGRGVHAAVRSISLGVGWGRGRGEGGREEGRGEGGERGRSAKGCAGAPAGIWGGIARAHWRMRNAPDSGRGSGRGRTEEEGSA